MKHAIWNLTKLAAAGAVIFGIGWAFVVTDEEGGVQEADADIGTVTTLEAVFERDFTKTMTMTGLTPRPYEMNGNQVYFAVSYVEEEPHEVLEHYQEQFVRAGINEKKYMEVPDGRFERSLGDIEKGDVDLSDAEVEYNKALLTGEVVPIVTRPGYMAMGGIVPKGAYRDVEEIVANWSAGNTREIDEEFMSGFRFIDAEQWPGQRGSRVTSVWSDDGQFDPAKMSDPQGEGVNPVLETPVCMGCRVGMQMESLSPNEKYRIGHFYSQRRKRDLVRFYQRSMQNRGFEESDAFKAVEYARNFMAPGEVPDGYVLSYNKGPIDSWIAVYDDTKTGETSVMVVEGY